MSDRRFAGACGPLPCPCCGTPIVWLGEVMATPWLEEDEDTGTGICEPHTAERCDEKRATEATMKGDGKR